jgi:hypothetical protein
MLSPNPPVWLLAPLSIQPNKIKFPYSQNKPNNNKSKEREEERGGGGEEERGEVQK